MQKQAPSRRHSTQTRQSRPSQTWQKVTVVGASSGCSGRERWDSVEFSSVCSLATLEGRRRRPMEMKQRAAPLQLHRV